MKTKHTPGPWIVLHSYNVMKDNRSIANCGGYTVNTPNWQEVDEENKANAQLVAAAPALLAALEKIAAGNPAKPGEWITDIEMADIARAAIAQVRGE